ncbi:uncharacterized protein LOC142353362 [Convolutriloba macropyga]|uniref:uncharacterized protein LOC142353362 n=1 Tax=Convolutriloba macropyga TaxID=536237 RepID=UPI003F52121F
MIQNVAVLIQHSKHIYRERAHPSMNPPLDTRDSLKNNDSIHVIAQFECQGKILRSKAAKFAIEKIDHVNQTMFKMFKEESNNDRNRDGAKKANPTKETQWMSLKILFVSLVILSTGLVITLFNYFRKKSERKFKKTKIDLQKLDENVVRYSTLRDSMQTYATLTTQRQMLHNREEDYDIDGDADNESIFVFQPFQELPFFSIMLIFHI